MRRILIIATVVAVVGGACSSASPTRLESLPQDLTMIALGDSYTRGTSIDFAGSWPAQLRDFIDETMSTSDLTVIADDGWNTKRLHREIGQMWDGQTRDLIVLEIGVNDLVLNFGEENFREGLALLADDIDGMRTDTSQVIVLSLPDFRATPWGQERIDRNYDFDGFNSILEAFAMDIDAAWIDITTISASALTDPELVAPDDLHFSADMYALWVEEITESLGQPATSEG